MGVRVALLGEDPLALSALSSGIDAALIAAPSRVIGPEIDVIVWDMGLDPRDALDRHRALFTSDRPIIALLPDETLAPEILGRGARAILDRMVDPARLKLAIDAVHGGLVVLDPDAALALARAPSEGAPTLTGREREVLELMAEGLSNKAIAARLGFSDHTAKFHVNALLAKLGAVSRTDVVVRAARLGLLSL